MAAMPLKQQVMDYVDKLDDERAEMVLVFYEKPDQCRRKLAEFKDSSRAHASSKGTCGT